MNQQMTGMLIGGVIPAFLFGLSAIFSKSSNMAGIDTGLYVLFCGIGVILVGLLICIFSADKTISFQSGIFASLVGITWAMASSLVAVGLIKYRIPISKLVTLYNMNTLVAVVIGLTVFAEWKEASTLKLISGSILIIAGGSLVATS